MQGWSVLMESPRSCTGMDRRCKVHLCGPFLDISVRRTRTDPSMWCFSTDGLGTAYALVAAYVDDFIITGVLGQDVGNLKHALRERFGGDRGKRKVSVSAESEFTRKKITPSCSANCHTRTLKSISLLWTQIVTLDRPRQLAKLHLFKSYGVPSNGKGHRLEMQSMISQPTLRLIKETNKLVSDVKRNDVALTIHLWCRS